MRKSDLIELIEQIKRIALEETPIVVGSQALHAITTFLPEIVQQSIECDFLIIGGKTENRAAINKKLGIFSDYQIENGFYADALGLATVVLPTGWHERLLPLEDGNGDTIAYYADIHDIAVSKLIAGRDKDFVFLKETFEREYILVETFLERAELINNMPQRDALIPRLETLCNYLPNRKSAAVKRMIAKLKTV